MAFKLANRVKMTVSGTPGTGTITLGSAISGFHSFADAAIQTGDIVPYVLEDGLEWEAGTGTYTASGTTLARTTISDSSNAGSAITASSSAVVYISPLAANLQSTDTLTSGTLPVSRGGTGASTLTGLVKGSGTSAFAAATAGTDYLAPPSGTAILKANSGGALANAVAGTDYVSPSSYGANVGTFLGTPSSANLAEAVTDETGSGSLVFGTSPTITTPTITFSTSATVTAGTNAQGQSALTTDFNIITTASSNPSGVTLPTATVGRRIIVVNKGANPVNVYPATGGTIDALSANASIQISANDLLEFVAYSTTSWYSNTLASLTGTLPVSSGGTGATTLTGIVKSNGTSAFTAAASGTDYQAPIGTISGIAKGNGANALTAATAGTDYVAPGGALGTPSSGVLSSCTGFSLPRISSTTSTATLTPNSGNFEQYILTAQAASLAIVADTGTPSNGQKLIFRIKDNGSPQTITWTTSGAKSFRAVGITLPTSTGTSKTTYVGCIYNTADSFWDAIATVQA